MRFFGRARRNGKTTTIVEWYRQSPETRRIITISEVEAQQLRDDYEIPHGHVYSYNRDRSAFYGLNGIEIGIDNVDIVLAQLYGNVSIASYTINL